MDHELMTTAEVAELFRVSPSQVRRWVQSGKLDAIKTPGDHYRFRQDYISDVLDDRKFWSYQDPKPKESD